jgi:hypothetical protein
MVAADQLHNGSRHLTLRSTDGASFLIPAWMINPEASSVKIVDVPCISIARLLNLRAFLESGLAFGPNEHIPKGGFDDERRDSSARGFVRRVSEDGVYDAASPNDRLLLGMKGAMSEVELAVFRQRSTSPSSDGSRRVRASALRLNHWKFSDRQGDKLGDTKNGDQNTKKIQPHI